MPKLTASRLRETYHYDPNTGMFTPIAQPSAGRHRRGGYIEDGYRLICIDYVRYRANRLAWLYMTGRWPNGVVDHRNGNSLDDRFDNLRDVSYSVNSQNRQSANRNKKDGLPLGVYRSGAKFESRIRIAGVNHTKGGFDTPDAAHHHYMEIRRVFMAGNSI